MVLLAESGAPLSVLIDKTHHYIMVSAQYFVFFFLIAIYDVMMFLQELIPNKTAGGCKHRAQYVPF